MPLYPPIFPMESYKGGALCTRGRMGPGFPAPVGDVSLGFSQLSTNHHKQRKIRMEISIACASMLKRW